MFIIYKDSHLGRFTLQDTAPQHAYKNKERPPFSGRRAVTSRSHDSQRGRAWCPGLPRGRRTLSGTPHPDAQVHHTAGSAAPSVRVSTNWPLTGPRAQEPSEEKKNWTTGETGASMNQEEGEPRVHTPFIARGSARRSAPFVAPPPFEAFPEASRKGASCGGRRAGDEEVSFG